MNRVKISVTVSADLLRRIDEEAARKPRASRSAVLDRWLRRALRQGAFDALREDTIRYYESLSVAEHAEDRAISAATGRHARHVRYDD